MTDLAIEAGPSLSERAAALLREKILDGTYATGRRLVEVELAATFQISRTPLREALRGLVQEGIVSHQPRRGFYVPEMTNDEARDLYELREAIESTAARWAAIRREEGELKLMYEYLDDAKRIIESGSDAPYPNDLDFHVLVMSASHSALIEQRGREVCHRLQLLRQRGGHSNERARVAHGEHCAIADAIKEGAADRAELMMRRHIENSQTRALAALTT